MLFFNRFKTVFLTVLVIIITCSKVNAAQSKDLENLLSSYNNAKSDQERLPILYDISLDYFYKKQDFKNAELYFVKTIQLAKKEGDEKVLANAYCNYGWLNFKIQKIDIAQKYIDLALTNTHLDEVYKKKAIIFKALIKTQQSNNIEALKIIEKNESRMPDSLKSKIYNLRGGIYNTLGNYEESLNNLYKAIQYYKYSKDNIDLGYSYNTVGLINNKQKNYATAIENYKKAIDAYKKTKAYDISYFVICLNIAQTYLESNKHKEAEVYLNNALKISKKNPERFEMDDLYYSYSLYYSKVGNSDKALDYAEKIIKNNKSDFDLGLALKAKIIKAKIFINRGQDENAKTILNEIITVSGKQSFLDIQLDATKELYLLYKKESNISAALSELEKYNKIKEALTSKEKVALEDKLKVDIEVLQLKHENDTHKKQIDLLAKKNEAERRNKFLLSGLVVLLLLLAYRQYRSYLGKKKSLSLENEVLKLKDENQQKEIELMNSKIGDFAIYINEKNELISDIREKLKSSLNVSTNIEAKDSLKKVIQDLKTDININNEQANFFSEITDSQKKFYYAISKKFPELSEKQKNLVMYLKIGYTSKQIAEKFNIEEQSINNQRYQIRKIMNIPKLQNLNDFINEL